MREKAPVARVDLEASLQASPFQRLFGFRLESFDSGTQTLVLRCPYGPNVERAEGSGQFHGGVIASLIDVAGDFALMAVLGYGVPTINFRIDYLKPATSTDLLARAYVRRLGRTIAVVDVDVSNATGTLIAVGRGCYSAKQG